MIQFNFCIIERIRMLERIFTEKKILFILQSYSVILLFFPPVEDSSCLTLFSKHLIHIYSIYHIVFYIWYIHMYIFICCSYLFKYTLNIYMCMCVCI